jgi:hypothetical protein
MSSRVKWGGIGGLVAAALLIVSAILNQMSHRAQVEILQVPARDSKMPIQAKKVSNS